MGMSQQHWCQHWAVGSRPALRKRSGRCMGLWRKRCIHSRRSCRCGAGGVACRRATAADAGVLAPTVGSRAGDSGGAPDAVIEGITGFVLNAKKETLLVEKIVELLLNKELSTRLGKQGRSWIEKQWQWPSRHLQLRKLLATDVS